MTPYVTDDILTLRVRRDKSLSRHPPWDYCTTSGASAILMPTESHWLEAISAGAARRPGPVTALTFLRDWPTASRPVLLSCDDGQAYVVKGRQNGRMIVTEHIIGRLGQALGAPVGQIGLVNIPGELIAIEPKLRHITLGPSHGSRWVQGCTERLGVEYTNVPENRNRFALLAVLYSWVEANDAQLIYQNSTPHLVHSVDHGHFFPQGPNWSIASISGAPPATLSRWFDNCCLKPHELREAQHSLERITDEDIAATVAGPLDDWGISMEERMTIAEYLTKRKAELLQVLTTLV